MKYYPEDIEELVNDYALNRKTPNVIRIKLKTGEQINFEYKDSDTFKTDVEPVEVPGDTVLVGGKPPRNRRVYYKINYVEVLEDRLIYDWGTQHHFYKEKKNRY